MILGLIIGGASVVFAIIVIVYQIKKISETEFVCTNCGKDFYPKISLSSLTHMNEKHVVRCPYCKHKDLMPPK